MDQSRVTLVCFAVKEEAAAFRRLAGRRPELEVLLTGMGSRNAERAIKTALAKSPPKLVLSCGFAGGLKPELASGSVLFAADPESGLEPALRAAGAQPARFHCAERVAITVAEKRVLRETTGADAVEMESQVICAFCREHRVTSAVIRVILDTAGEDLPLDFNRLMTPEQRLDGVKLALALLKSPGKIGELRRFQKQTQAAAQRLGEVLARVTGTG
jgi:nucleoside phosphorylase